MPQITVQAQGLLYKNPIPHVRSVHGYFPSVAMLDNGEMLASGVLGEAFEAHNCRTHIFRSTDQGVTWENEGPIYAGPPHPSMSDFSRITALGGGKVVAIMTRHDRRELLDDGLSNPETLGFAPRTTVRPGPIPRCSRRPWWGRSLSCVVPSPSCPTDVGFGPHRPGSTGPGIARAASA
ncbi:MAG: hypothetical protein L3K26_08620 [Candidatus Hydrogenedentes bacterium]|nr:hypothetical protein [Candidatus Hydrogenedentota bacterium]